MPWLRRKPGQGHAGGDYLFLDEAWEYYAYHMATGQFEVVTEDEALGRIPPAPEPEPPAPAPYVCVGCGMPYPAHANNCPNVAPAPEVERNEPPDTTGNAAPTPTRRGRPAASSSKKR